MHASAGEGQVCLLIRADKRQAAILRRYCHGLIRTPFPFYRSGRVNHWLKVKNPAAPAVRREAEEDWSGKRRTGGGMKRIEMSDREK